MSSPVKVSVDIVDLNLFAEAANNEGYTMKQIKDNDGVVVGLTHGEGYRETKVIFDEEKQKFILHADSHHVDSFKQKVIPHYNALQLRARMEESNRYTFPENWMQRQANGDISVSAFMRVG